jgi:hypothetical protein
MSSVDASYIDEYRPGDRIKVIDGTFVGSEGYVIDAKEALAKENKGDASNYLEDAPNNSPNN